MSVQEKALFVVALLLITAMTIALLVEPSLTP